MEKKKAKPLSRLFRRAKVTLAFKLSYNHGDHRVLGPAFGHAFDVADGRADRGRRHGKRDSRKCNVVVDEGTGIARGAGRTAVFGAHARALSWKPIVHVGVTARNGAVLDTPLGLAQQRALAHKLAIFDSVVENTDRDALCAAIQVIVCLSLSKAACKQDFEHQRLPSGGFFFFPCILCSLMPQLEVRANS